MGECQFLKNGFTLTTFVLIDGHCLLSSSSLQISENFAFFADFQLVFLTEILGAVTECTAEKPAEMAAMKFPGWAGFFCLTIFLFPTGRLVVFSSPLIDEQKIDLPLDIIWDSSPALLVTVDSL